MPSNYDNELGVELQAAGENLNTWGQPKLNNALTRLIKGIAGFITVALTGNLTLTSSNTSTAAADYQARHAAIKFTGTGAFTVTVPSSSKAYMIWNACTGVLTVTTGAGDSASVGVGELVAVLCDGTNVRKVMATAYGGERITGLGAPVNSGDAVNKSYADGLAFNTVNLPGQGAASVGKFVKSDGTVAAWEAITVADVAGAAPISAPSFTGGVTIASGASISGGLTYAGSTKANVTAVPALNIDLTSTDFFTKAISINSAFTFSGAVASSAMAFTLLLTITSAAVPSWPASVKYAGGLNPSSTLGNGTHRLGFITDDGGTTWLMVVIARAIA